MTILPLILISAGILLIAYHTYGRFVVRRLGLDDKNTTPAERLKDGIDYEPGKTPVVLGHHFASIAGAGPIVGPIIAITFGWVPAVIWILLGGIFLGAVHDLASLTASMRHDGKSIGGLIERYVGRDGKRLFLIFSFATLILVIAVFADIIARTFISNPEVAASSGLYIIVALLFGMLNKRYPGKTAFLILSVVGVVIMYSFVYVGMWMPVTLSYNMWILLLMAYAFIASVTPVWLLLQPRDYLSSFLLYGLMIFAVAGVFVANPIIQMSTEVNLHVENLGYLFPVLFVTVACGAISGFHSLVASGTTSKQIDKESNAKVVGYGGMLLESFLAIIAVCSVIIIGGDEYGSRLMAEGPVSLFASGLGGMIASVGLPPELAVTFVALTVSAFALTTFDTCTRLARFTVQEYFEDYTSKPAKFLSGNRYAATLLVIMLSVLLLGSGEFATLWPIFGSANQLLAALALLAVSVWLIRIKVKPLFVLIPTFFMFAVTLSSLLLFAFTNLMEGSYLLCIISGLLFILALAVTWLAIKSLIKRPDTERAVV